MEHIHQFNLRVYGVCIDAQRLLVTDEIRFGIQMTKLPGGGLQFGEGLEKCLKREWMEELGAEIEVGDILFANPFLQISAFNAKDEVICLYFRVYPQNQLQGRFTESAMDFVRKEEGAQSFRWIPLDELSESDFTFPIDQALVSKLKRML